MPILWSKGSGFSNYKRLSNFRDRSIEFHLVSELVSYLCYPYLRSDGGEVTS